jgi:hypothetical protein
MMSTRRRRESIPDSQLLVELVGGWFWNDSGIIVAGRLQPSPYVRGYEPASSGRLRAVRSLIDKPDCKRREAIFKVH